MIRFRSSLLVAFVLASSGLSALADKAAVSPSPKGVKVDFGSMGALTLGLPTLSLGEKGTPEKPVPTVNGNTIELKYPAGTTVRIIVSKEEGSAQVTYSGLPAGASSLNFSMQLPMSLNAGGQFSFDQKEKHPFPETFGKQIVADGTHKEFHLFDFKGNELTVVAPTAYMQIQDHRAFKTEIFTYKLFYRFANHRNQDRFEIKFRRSKSDGNQTAFLVDRYGQSARVDYPSKITSDEQLKADARQQLSEVYKPDPKLDKYGGLAGSGERYGLKKTGFFQVGKVEGRDVFITPEGNIFFQLGMCGIASTDDNTLVKGREEIYEWLPPKSDPQFLTAWRQSKPENGVFSFYSANLIRKFGKPFDIEEWSGQAITRLRRWGFNSSGAFSTNTKTMRAMEFPTVHFLSYGPPSKSLPDKLGAATVIDPFAPGVEEALDEAFAKSVAPRASDPLLIGYFQGNEQHLENLPKVIPGYRASKVAAKAKLVSMLKEKYKTIDAFNKAWKPSTPVPSWEAAAEEPLFVRSDAGAEDMKQFCRLYLESYYSLVHRVFKKHDPNHLLLGSRWTPNTSNNEDVVRIAGKYLDVISINYYTDAIEKGFLDKVHQWSGGKPILLSEWHYGARDQGLSVHREVKDQRARGEAYRNYVEQSAALPYVIGCQWFIYSDQSITGRFFSGFHGESNNTGFVNVVDRPYEELVAAAKLTHDRIYDVMFGKVSPYVYDDPRFTGDKNGANANRVVTAMRAPAGLKLDGTTKNWPAVPGEPIEPSRTLIGVPKDTFRADYRVCWDNTNLYFFIHVQDDSPLMNEQEGDRLWSADGVELFIGHQNLETPGGLIYSDRQVLLGAGKEGRAHIMDNADKNGELQVLAVKDVDGKGYVLEAFIPWKALEIEPKAGMELLFDVAVDNSDDGRIRTHQLGWNATNKISKDRGVWGKLRLE